MFQIKSHESAHLSPYPILEIRVVFNVPACGGAEP
jgi:hypothetical protein